MTSCISELLDRLTSRVLFLSQLAVLTEVLDWSPVSPPQNLSAAVMYKIKSRGLSFYGATAARTAAEAAGSV
jgi:hypothetical protein